MSRRRPPSPPQDGAMNWLAQRVRLLEGRLAEVTARLSLLELGDQPMTVVRVTCQSMQYMLDENDLDEEEADYCPDLPVVAPGLGVATLEEVGVQCQVCCVEVAVQTDHSEPV
eukprot:12005944-Alexandrium_andersonii.AAC.1